MNKFSILAVFIFLGCAGSRNVDLTQHEDININNTYQEGSKIVLANTFTYTPFDALKPMIIEGKTYSNAIVSSDKSKTYIKWKNIYTHTTITITKTKIIDRTNHDFLYLGIFAILALFLFLWFKLKNPVPWQNYLTKFRTIFLKAKN